MQRSTPSDTLHRAYDSGGARCIIDAVDDMHMMQEMAGNFMKGESHKGLESPQNYGFSSVVLPSTKGQDGQIDECAEGFISFIGGNRSFPVCTVMDDRRHRPWALNPGENCQYGPNTDYGRTLTYIKPTPQKQGGSSGSGGGASAQAADAPTLRDGGGGSSGGSSQDYGLFLVVPHPQEYASMRHINNQKQPKPQSQQSGQQGGASSGQSGQSGQQQYNHEKGQSINTEIRCTNSRIEFRSGDTVVGYYDKSAQKWSFTGEMHLGQDDASHPVYGVNGGVGKTTNTSGSGAVLVNAPQPGPPTSGDVHPLSIEERLSAIEARLTQLGV